MMSSGPSVLKISFYAVATALSLPLAYYAVQESIRYRMMRKRRRRFAQRMHHIDAKLASDSKVDTGEELEAVKELFGSMSILGRYQNPFTEWREEGAWEWFAWQLVWRPLTGRIWWEGGIADPEERQRILPSERPNFRLIFGTDPHVKDVGRIEDLTMLDSLIPKPADNLDVVTGPENEAPPLPNRKAPSTPDSWDSLAASCCVTQEFTCTWFGQSTCFVTLDGCCILTDPVFSDRLVEWAGPQRQRPPPAPLAHLLRVDVVLVSHDHFDHLDLAVVDYLGDTALWVVPAGLGVLIRSKGVTRVVELDWWQQTTLDAHSHLQVTFCPSMHWTARSPTTTNQSLWGSYVVQGKKDSFFHCGDSGYVPALAEQIGRHFGPLSLALLPIGAYQPRWHLAPQHMDPESAVSMHRALRAKKSIGYHWGTWSLSDDRYDDPLKDLAIARKLHAITDDVFMTLPLGRTLVLS